MANAINSQTPVNKKRVIAGLDIGTTKVACVIASIGSENIEVIGVGPGKYHRNETWSCL